jgi:tight adherence protein B
MSLLVAVVTGGLTFAAALIVLTTQRRSLVRQRLAPYVGSSEEALRRTRSVRSVLRPQGAIKRALVRLGLDVPAARQLDRAGAGIGTDALAAIVVAAAAITFLVVLLAANAPIALAAAVAGGALPWLVLELKGRRRSRAFERQLPDILDTLAASLRAGHSFDQAVQSLAIDMPDPAGNELRRVVAASQLGRSVDESLGELGNRIESEDLQFVLDAIVIQRQVGGSLAGLFELVAQTVRAREEFRRKVRALTSLPRASANVLTILPVGAAVAMTIQNGSYMRPLWHSSTGHLLLLAGVAMVACGGVVLRRVGSVKA